MILLNITMSADSEILTQLTEAVSKLTDNALSTSGIQAASQEVAAYRTAITNLFLRDIPFGDVSLLCDISLGKPRPVIPKEWTYRVFQAIHSLADAGPRPTQRAIADRYVWHGLKRDIRR